ncbi:MAG: helix-turn-helix transcriptional regulator [Flavobacteriales bacterium]|jgi:transcriptional regulator with XRE-family HTH domain|nr:helix-turn-helix transcriptional regulator [Flavobacteriales bacterium]
MEESVVLKNIKKIRELKDLKQEYVAQELNLSTRAYAKLEAGETGLTLKRIFEISKVFEIKPEELLGFDSKTIFNNCTESGNHNKYIKNDIDLFNKIIESKNEQIQVLKDYIQALKR